MILVDARTATVDALVTCPDCEGAGEVTVPGSVTQNMDGVWDRDVTTCVACAGFGAVTEDRARVCTPCGVATFWVDQVCLEHDDHCPGCHPARCPELTDVTDVDPWLIGGAA